MHATNGTLGRVAELRIYPIKSLAGVSVERALLTDLGLAGDRRWMLVDDAGVFLTQRVFPRMALGRAVPNGDGVRVTGADLEPIEIAPPPADAPRRHVQVWDDVVEAQGYPEEVDEWFTELLRRPCHLVYMPNDVRRRVDPTYAGPDDRAAFSDAFPILLLSRESLADLNERLAAREVPPVEILRFRPNVVVEHVGAPYAEDDWRDIAIGDAALRVVKPCARCVLTTVNPTTGEPSPRGEPLRTLATYRTRNGKVLFAQNALVAREGTVRVREEITRIDQTAEDAEDAEETR